MANGISATYISANQFSVSGDQTQDFHAGRRVKAELTGGNVYSTISGSTYSTNTTVALYDSELDNTLTLVWYGIGIGSEGSLPDHTHGGSEGSGGTISGTVGTFLDLTDTPFSYTGHAGKSAVVKGDETGLEFVTVSGGAGDFLAQDGSTPLTGDWDFGSFTISGTGDIWCQDLHTAGGSLYIGDVALTSAANVLNYGSNTISGTGDVAAGRLGLGDVVDLSTQISIFQVIAETVGWGSFYKYSDDVTGSAPTYFKARGTYASPTAVQAGDVIGGYNVHTYDGSVFDIVGKIRHLVESISSGNVKSYIEFHVSDTSGVEQEMARLNSTGLIVGDAVDQQSDYALHVKDGWAIVSLEGDTSTSDAGIRLERESVTKWHLWNDATGGGAADMFKLQAEGGGFDSLRISNANCGVGIGFEGTRVPDATRLCLVSDEAIGTLTMYQYSDDSGGSAFSGYKARGGNQASPTAVQAGDVITGYNAAAYDGSTMDIVGRNRHLVESISSGDIASYWELHTSDTSGLSREVVRINSAGALMIGDDFTNANMVIGLTINQGANDDDIISLKSSDIAHGATNQTETDTFAYFRKALGDYGGLIINAYQESGSSACMALGLQGKSGTAADTTKGTSARAIVETYATELSGLDQSNVTANGNIFGVKGRTGGSAELKFIVDIEGDTWQDGNLGIGTEATSANLEIYQAGTALHNVFVKRDSATNYHILLHNDDTIGGQWGFSVQNDGSLGIDERNKAGAYQGRRLTLDTGGLINFGASTISGTGDIYCNDIHTSGGTVHIGSEQISSPSPGVLDFGGSSFENVIIPMPTEGIGGNWILVEEVGLSGDSDTTISGLNGNVDERYLIISRFLIVASNSNRNVKIRPNNDSGANYRCASHYADTTPTSGQEDLSSENGLIIGRGAWGDDGIITAETTFHAKSGIQRAALTLNVWYGTETSGRLSHQRNHSYWSNTDDNITSLTFDFDGGTASGTVQLYRWQDGVVDYEKGRQELFIEYATTSGINILPGRIDIEDGSNEYALQVSGTLFKDSNSLSASTWYYIYAKPPISGNYLSESEIELSTTAPARNTTKMGYYHGTNTDWRCFGAFYTNASSELYSFSQIGSKWVFDDYIYTDVNADTPSDAWTDVVFNIPFGSTYVLCRSSADYIDTAVSLRYRKKGTSGDGITIGYVNVDVDRSSEVRDLPIDIDKKGQYRFHTATAGNIVYLQTIGFTLPNWIAPK